MRAKTKPKKLDSCRLIVYVDARLCILTRQFFVAVEHSLFLIETFLPEHSLVEAIQIATSTRVGFECDSVDSVMEQKQATMNVRTCILKTYQKNKISSQSLCLSPNDCELTENFCIYLFVFSFCMNFLLLATVWSYSNTTNILCLCENLLE